MIKLLEALISSETSLLVFHMAIFSVPAHGLFSGHMPPWCLLLCPNFF